MTAYLYATRPDDYEQHLLPERDGKALCGASSRDWHYGAIATRPHTGVVLCDECAGLRYMAKRQAKIDAAQAALDAERARVKTFWTKEATR